jgi:vacuolar-type H+-ATPase subunit F/Vma7
MEGKVAVIGDADFVMPFSALGLDTFAVTGKAGDIKDNGRKIAEDRYSLVVVAENVAPAIENIFACRLNEPTPCIVVVPFTTESVGYATKSLNRAIRLATGVDIMRD